MRDIRGSDEHNDLHFNVISRLRAASGSRSTDRDSAAPVP